MMNLFNLHLNNCISVDEKSIAFSTPQGQSWNYRRIET